MVVPTENFEIRKCLQDKSQFVKSFKEGTKTFTKFQIRVLKFQFKILFVNFDVSHRSFELVWDAGGGRFGYKIDVHVPSCGLNVLSCDILS